MPPEGLDCSLLDFDADESTGAAASPVAEEDVDEDLLGLEEVILGEQLDDVDACDDGGLRIAPAPELNDNAERPRNRSAHNASSLFEYTSRNIDDIRLQFLREVGQMCGQAGVLLDSLRLRNATVACDADAVQRQFANVLKSPSIVGIFARLGFSPVVTK